jgi:hypothetical protein
VLEKFFAYPLSNEFRQDPKVVKPEEAAVRSEGVVGNASVVLDYHPGLVVTDIVRGGGQQREPDLNPFFGVIPMAFGGDGEGSQFPSLFRYRPLYGNHTEIHSNRPEGFER